VTAWGQAALLQHSSWTYHFASEIKALLEDEQQERGVNEEAFITICHLMRHQPHTLSFRYQKLAQHMVESEEDGQVRECGMGRLGSHGAIDECD